MAIRSLGAYENRTRCESSLRPAEDSETMKGFLLLPGRKIGTALAPHTTRIDTLGYDARDTRTHFSEVRIADS